MPAHLCCLSHSKSPAAHSDREEVKLELTGLTGMLVAAEATLTRFEQVYQDPEQRYVREYESR